MEPFILYEDKNFLVVEKPAGMIVNRADTAKHVVTLQDWVEKKKGVEHLKPKSEDKEKYQIGAYNKYDEFINRSGIVHRLDKETSGIILIAKNTDTFIALQNQFKSGDVKKVYQALVHGRMEEGTGEIEANIGRLPWNRKRFGVLPEGRTAKTQYKVLQSGKVDGVEVSFIEVYPQTGRTHQIRVHFQHIHHPIFSDELYAGRKQGRDDRKILPHHFLHASKIILKNPETNTPLEFESKLPSDLSDFLLKLQ